MNENNIVCLILVLKHLNRDAYCLSVMMLSPPVSVYDHYLTREVLVHMTYTFHQFDLYYLPLYLRQLNYSQQHVYICTILLLNKF